MDYSLQGSSVRGIFQARVLEWVAFSFLLVIKNYGHFGGFPGDLGSIPGLGRSPGEGNGSLLQYSYLENPMDRGSWWATVHGVTKSRTRFSD